MLKINWQQIPKSHSVLFSSPLKNSHNHMSYHFLQSLLFLYLLLIQEYRSCILLHACHVMPRHRFTWGTLNKLVYCSGHLGIILYENKCTYIPWKQITTLYQKKNLHISSPIPIWRQNSNEKCVCGIFFFSFVLKNFSCVDYLSPMYSHYLHYSRFLAFHFL